MTLTGLISNLYVAPMFRHEPESTDFLMILTPPSGQARPGQRESMGVILRDLPSSVFTVGQTEPRTRVYAPNTQGEKNFVGPYVSFQIARAIQRSEAKDSHGLRFDELQDRVLPNLELSSTALRQRLKQVAIYDKNTSIWTTKPIGFEDYPGVDALGKSISPEGVAAFQTANAARLRLTDLGIHQLFAGSQTVASIGAAMVYLAGQLNYTRELSRKTKKLVEISRVNKSISSVQNTFYEKAAAKLDSRFKILRQKHEIASFIYEQLQLAPWHLTGEFIEVHKKGEGTGMMKLTGLGDPSGQGEGFSFLREADAKPQKAVGQSNLNSQIKKITGTEDDLRKLTMKQMASLLRSYGMPQKQIDTLKRWDRVHVIRDLSTKAASDGIGDGLERFARGEKMKLSEQKQMYRDRVQVIWKRQIAALSMDSGDKMGGTGADGGGVTTEGEGDALGSQAAAAKKSGHDADQDDSDDSESDDDLAAALEEEMMDRSEVNQLVAAHTGDGTLKEGTLGQLRAAVQDRDLAKDARELAALKRQREEERAAQEGLQAMRPKDDVASTATKKDAIRKRIVKTHPDGRQTVTFKFIVQSAEVNKIWAKLSEKPDHDTPKAREMNYEHGANDKPPGHSIFEDDDNFEYASKGGGRHHTQRRRGAGKKSGAGGAGRRTGPRKLVHGKLKTKVSKEDRLKKRKREDEELEVYTATAKRKGTSNRRERGSIRERRPHIIFSEKLEHIRFSVESLPIAGPFIKPVSRKRLPQYFECISHPIDLQTIRDKNSKYEYHTADAFICDFELMKSNAIRFNGEGTVFAKAAEEILDYVKDQVDSIRSELTPLEEQVAELMSGKPKKKRKKAGTAKKSKSAASSNLARIGGVAIDLGDVSKHLGEDDSDSGESVYEVDIG